MYVWVYIVNRQALLLDISTVGIVEDLSTSYKSPKFGIPLVMKILNLLRRSRGFYSVEPLHGLQLLQ